MTQQKYSAKLYIPSVKDIKPVFDAIDTDMSGGIDENELWQAMQKLGINMSREHAKSIIELMDDDKNGTMEFEEFRKFLFVIQNGDAGNLASLLFFIADANYSGEIDAQELVSVLGKLGLQVQINEAQKLVELFAGPQKSVMNYSQFMTMIEQLTE